MMRAAGILLGLLLGCSAAPPPAPEPPAWTLKFSSALKTDKASKGMVYVRIEKTVPGIGTVERRHIQFDGDRIGWWEETPDAGAVSVHPVKLRDGRTVEVDFDIGATLVSVMPIRKVIEVRRCKPVYDPGTAAPLYCEPIVEKRGWDGYEITYRDAQATHRVLVPDPAQLDQLCSRHR